MLILEGVKQVYALVCEWMSQLEKEDREKLRYSCMYLVSSYLSKSRYILYDDMCHLGPFTQRVNNFN